MNEFFLKFASSLYSIGVNFRNFLYNSGIIQSTEFDIPVICVGNITVGGTGKTPAVEAFVRHFTAQQKHVGIISRGYGRKTKGYREVTIDDSYRSVGDEPLQIKRKFRDATVVVCEKRVYGIRRMQEEHPELDIIIMDDGFQHRKVKAYINVIMVDATRPVQQDRMLPMGQLRDSIDSLVRAHYFIVTKCSKDMNDVERRIHMKVLKQKAAHTVYFANIKSGEVKPVFDEIEPKITSNSEVIAMSGIGNNEVFFSGIASRFRLVDTIALDDHHAYRMADLVLMEEMISQHPDAYIVTTEKDAVKLSTSKKVPQRIRQRLYYQEISMHFERNTAAEFFSRIDKDIENKDNNAYIRGV